MRRISSLSALLLLMIFNGPLLANHYTSDGPLVLQRAATAPKIDGRLDDACWHETDVRPLLHYAGGELRVGGRVALSYDDEHLYAAMWLDEPKPDAIVSAAEPKDLWDGEVVEWFICPSIDGRDYFQLAWNPAGRQFAIRCKSTGVGSFTTDKSWQPPWSCASVIDENGWTTEAAIPFDAMQLQRPKEGTAWRLNLCRQRLIGERTWSAMASTGPSGFHTIDMYEDGWFGSYTAAKVASREGAPLRALIGCWGVKYGYGAVFDPHNQLDRALGADQVDIRVISMFSGTFMDWPRRDADLAPYHLIVLTDTSASALSPRSVRDLKRYVFDGGSLILAGSMTGWRHKPVDAWWTDAGGRLAALRAPEDSTFDTAMRPVRAVVSDHPLLKGLPIADDAWFVRARTMTPLSDATVVATAGDVPFIIERRVGKGRVIQINGEYAHKATGSPIDSPPIDLLRSPWNAVFWDNVVAYATGRNVPQPAKTPTFKRPEVPPIRIDLIRDNYGNVFAPGDTVQCKLRFVDAAPSNGAVQAYVDGATAEPMPIGQSVFRQADPTIRFALPRLDAGRYTLRLVVSDSNGAIGSASDSFHVVLPDADDDAFNFGVMIEPDAVSARDAGRIFANLRDIGFTDVLWVGGNIYGEYDDVLRQTNRSRFTSLAQSAGLNTSPVWYTAMYKVLYGEAWNTKPGKRDRVSGLPMPSPVTPADGYLPYAHFWLSALADKAYGRLPRTHRYSGGDEMIGARYADRESEAMRAAFEQTYGHAPPSKAGDPGAYEWAEFRLRGMSDFLWLARSVSNAYAPKLVVESVTSPNSLAGHSSSLVDVYGMATALNATPPDEYHYGEPKLYMKSLSSAAILWSATQFGDRGQLNFMGGHLSNGYYDQFPEQVFAAISAGARNFDVFHYSCTNFETHGRRDERFAAIARRTTADAGRIGRTLNHYQRSRARVAMLYPHTAHVWRSMGKDFNDDYLKMTGSSDQYLRLTYAVQAQFDLLRQMFGHVDVMFDEQIQRGELSDYDVVVVGYSRQVEAATLRALRRFVEQGGTLLVSTDSAQRDEHNKVNDALYTALPAGLGAERSVSTDYSDTRMSNPAPFSIGHVVEPRDGAEVLFTHADGEVAAVRGRVGRGEAIVMGMPLAALRSDVGAAKRRLVEHLLRGASSLISRPDDGQFSAITFEARRGEGRIFMVANHRKAAATTTVRAWADESMADWSLCDIVNGERVPFAIERDAMHFDVSCDALWGRALALLPNEPISIEVNASAPSDASRWLISVRLLDRAGRPLGTTLPFDLKVVSPDGAVRDDLSGERVAERGVYVLVIDRAVNAQQGEWTVIASERISGESDEATWTCVD